MATHLLVDGYNLLGAFGALFGRLDSARDELLRDLAAYRHRKNHPITVVFDGWREGLSTEQREFRSGIEVIYSKRGEKADQVIQRLVRRYGADCAVVTSDREIVNTARSHGAFVLGAQEFAGRLYGPSSGGAVPHKELDSGDEPPPARGPGKKGNPRKLPKAQRRRQSQLRRF